MLFASSCLNILVCDYKLAWLTSSDAYPTLSAKNHLKKKIFKNYAFSIKVSKHQQSFVCNSSNSCNYWTPFKVNTHFLLFLPWRWQTLQGCKGCVRWAWEVHLPMVTSGNLCKATRVACHLKGIFDIIVSFSLKDFFIIKLNTGFYRWSKKSVTLPTILTKKIWRNRKKGNG